MAMRFGLIGAGGIAQAYGQIFHVVGEADLVAVADVRPEAAQAMAEGAGCPSFAGHEELANGADVDAVLICTPPSTHPEICRFFLERGTPVLCEKPLSTDSGSARALVQLAADRNVTFTMATKFRYVQDVIRAKSIVESGILGEVVLFENAFTSRVDMSQRWNSKPEISGGGVVIDNGTHSVDIVRYFVGPIAEVFGVEGKRIQSVEVEDTARLFLRSVGGVLGSVDLSWSINKELESYLEIYGSHGVIRVGWRESKYRQISSKDWVVFGNGYDKVQAMGSQVRNFARACNGEEPLLVTGEDAIASVEVVEAIYRSLAKDCWTPVYDEAPERRTKPREASVSP